MPTSLACGMLQGSTTFGGDFDSNGIGFSPAKKMGSTLEMHSSASKDPHAGL